MVGSVLPTVDGVSTLKSDIRFMQFLHSKQCHRLRTVILKVFNITCIWYV